MCYFKPCVLIYNLMLRIVDNATRKEEYFNLLVLAL